MWDNYDYVFYKYPFFWEALKNSTTWAILGAVVQIPIAALIALALSRKVKGIKFVRNVYIIPNMISTAAMGIVFLQLYNPSYGIINPIIRLFNKEFRDNILLLKGPAFVAMTCAYIFFTGTTTLMILGNIMAVPEEVREAAMLDGVKRSETGLVYYNPYDQRNFKNSIRSCCNLWLPSLQRSLFPDKRSCRNLQYQLHYPRACHYQSENPVWTCQCSGNDSDPGWDGNHLVINLYTAFFQERERIRRKRG